MSRMVGHVEFLNGDHIGIKCLVHDCPVGDELDAYKTLRQYDKIMQHVAKHCLDCRCNASNNPPPKPVPLSFWLKLLIPIGSTIGACAICLLDYNKWFALPLVIIAIVSMIYIDKSMST